MLADNEHLSIERAIARFADAYQTLEALQAREAVRPPAAALLPSKGDQKTGLIGEYWAIRYARLFFNNSPVTFGGHSQKGWDLKVENPAAGARYIQVKTASNFGNGKLSPICKPSKRQPAGESEELPDYWNELWLLWLDRTLQPVVLWKFKPEHIEFGSEDCLKGRSIRRHPDEQNTGSTCFRWHEAEPVTSFFHGEGDK